MTQDINTAAHEPVSITTLAQLTDCVGRAASIQLAVNQALAEQQARHEAAKAAFEAATREIEAEKASLLAGIYAFCEANKDLLFPAKKGARVKTFPVLAHKLQYRSATSITAPPDALDIIHNLLAEARAQLDHPGLTSDEETRLHTDIRALEGLLRTKEELNKDAAKTVIKNNPGLAESAGLAAVTTEGFNLAFTFTPDA